jgi:hypothetical protein
LPQQLVDHVVEKLTLAAPAVVLAALAEQAFLVVQDGAYPLNPPLVDIAHLSSDD